jgi:hypothetical protein
VNSTQPGNYDNKRRGRHRRAGVVVATVTAAVGLAACGGGGGSAGPNVASVGSVSTTTTAVSTSTKIDKGPLAMSRCMRAHGITNFPDPDSNGGISINGGNGKGSIGLDPRSAKFQAAQKACAPLGGPNGTPAQQAQAQAEALKFAQCMRAHGLPDFPDPSAGGGLIIQQNNSGEKSSSNLNPNSPVFQAAQKACQSLAPGRNGPLTHTEFGSSGGKGS